MANWDHQLECLNVMQQSSKGVIVLPTGSGKSRVEFEYAKSKLSRDDNIHQIVIIVAPRIILCQQLIKNFYDYMLSKFGSVKEAFTFVSSGQVPRIKVGSVNTFVGHSTTKIDEIALYTQNHRAANRDSVIFSTYASFDRCIAGIKKGMVGDEEIYLLADEAHYFTNAVGKSKAFEALEQNLNLFKGRFFLTATPQFITGADINTTAMNNSDIYGEVIYNKQPSKLIENGVICEPRLHKVNLPKNISPEGFDRHSGDFVFKSFKIHERIINSKCAEDIKIGGKLIVAVDGSQQMHSLINNGFVKKARDRGINVAWTMSNSDIGSFFNGKEYSTEDFLLKIRGICFNSEGQVKNSTRLIVLHYDQLTEGIDVPSMTGLMILRSMNKVKKVQNIGRVLRSHPDDHCKDPNFREDWVKPYSYIIVPNFVGVSRFDELIVQLRNEYDAKIEIETPDSAYGLDENCPQLQNTEHKISEFKYISGDIQHNIEEVDRYKKRIWKQIEQKQKVDLRI